MPVIKYNKLVRDRIPEIIRDSGKACVCQVLSDEMYLQMLDEKLGEELGEYQQSKSMEELADLLEVIRAVALARGSSIQEIEAIRAAKAAKRGAFEKKLLLKEVRQVAKVAPLYRRKVDASLFEDGFVIPLDIQDDRQSRLLLDIGSGESDITLVIQGQACAATLRNLPIDRQKNPRPAPLVQVRYRPSDAAAARFRSIFAEAWQDMCREKQFAAPREHVGAERQEAFTLYTTDEPATFIIQCHVAEGV